MRAAMPWQTGAGALLTGAHPRGTAGATGRVWPAFLFLKRSKDFALISNLFRFLKHRMTQNIQAVKSRLWAALGLQGHPWDTWFRPPPMGHPGRGDADMSPTQPAETPVHQPPAANPGRLARRAPEDGQPVTHQGPVPTATRSPAWERRLP